MKRFLSLKHGLGTADMWVKNTLLMHLKVSDEKFKRAKILA